MDNGLKINISKERTFALDTTEAFSMGLGGFWNTPRMVKTEVFDDRIEITYRQSSQIAHTSYPPQYPPDRIYKIVFSCVDGKWHKSEPIFGKIVPATPETFEF